MKPTLAVQQIIIVTFICVFILTFFVFFRETHELLSSLTAALFSAALTIGALITIYWIYKALK